jgi:hypothetical protein
MSDVRIPTEFTPEQLERLREIVANEEARAPVPETYNLARKLEEYCRRFAPRVAA